MKKDVQILRHEANFVLKMFSMLDNGTYVVMHPKRLFDENFALQ